MSHINSFRSDSTLDHQIKNVLDGNMNRALAMYSESQNDTENDRCLLLVGDFDIASGVEYEIGDPLNDEIFSQQVARMCECTVDDLNDDPRIDLGCFSASVSGIGIVDIPGVTKQRCESGDPMDILKRFVSENRITGYQTVSIRRAENFAYRYRKALGLGPVREVYGSKSSKRANKKKNNGKRGETDDLFDMFGKEYSKHGGLMLQ